MIRNATFVFPGSASQYVGMGKELYDKFNTARKIFDLANEVLDRDIKRICFEGSVVKLNKIENVLPAIFITSVAYGEILINDFGIRPNTIIGHSLGEFSALTCAKAFDFAEALNVVQFRSRLAKKVAEETNSEMCIISGIYKEELQKYCSTITENGGYAEIACCNSEDQFLVSGYCDSITHLIEKLNGKTVKIIELIGSAPYHSKLMIPILDELRDAICKCDIQCPEYRVISNISNIEYQSREIIIDELCLQMISKISWNRLLNNTISKSDFIIDVGPGQINKNIISIISKSKVLAADGQLNDLKGIKEEFIFSEEVKFYENILRHIVSSPNYNSELDVNLIKSIYLKYSEKINKLLSEKRIAEKKNINEVISDLKHVMNEKNVDIEEQNDRISELFRCNNY